MDDYIKFNRKAKEFLKDITTTFPQLSDLRTMKNALKVIKKISKKTPQRVFEDVVTPHKQYILARDNDFFLSGKFQNDNLTGLKTIWPSLTDDNRTHIWNHLHILVILSDACKKLESQGTVVSDEDVSDSN